MFTDRNKKLDRKLNKLFKKRKKLSNKLIEVLKQKNSLDFKEITNPKYNMENIKKSLIKLENFLIDLFDSYKLVVFCFLFIIFFLTFIFGLAIIEYLIYTRNYASIILNCLYYISWSVTIPLILLFSLFRSNNEKRRKTTRVIFYLSVYTIFIFIIEMFSWNILNANISLFITICLLMSMIFSIYIEIKIIKLYSWIKNGYYSSLNDKNTDELDVKSKLLSIIISISITSIASLFAIIASLYKAGEILYKIIKQSM